MKTRRWALALALALLMVSLATLLGLQWRALRDIRETEPKARWSALRELVQELAHLTSEYYRPRARAALIVPPELFTDRAALAKHFARTRFDGTREFFLIDMIKDPAGETLVFDGHAFVSRAGAPVIHSRPPQWLPPSELDRTPLLYFDDSGDTNNRAMYFPVRNARGTLLGMTGLVLDNRWALQFVGAAAQARLVRTVGPARARETVMAIRDGNGRALWLSQEGKPQQVDVHYTFEYVFRDWTIAAQSRTVTPEQLAERSFRLALAANLLVAAIALGAALLAYRASIGEARVAAMKEAFVSNVSHELRTPLASIVLFGRLLRLGEHRRSETMRYGNFIEAEGERLSRMVEKILTFSRTLNEPVVRKPVDLCALVRQTALDLTPPDVELDVDCDRGPLIVPVDEGAIRQALRNLIENAAHYANGSKRIEVRVDQQANVAAISVRDFGYGIDPDDQVRIFERFFRSADPRVGQVRGTGLGLSIVKSVADAHGGSVAVDSRVGEGSTFTIRLPLEDS
ncbi:MAG TPA: HAMP domain-containing sensor histidine kinase [Thermoanaerobaculia bacterium]|nr:HAMP domain-containing sensor histidine kinase [Thermoanaerobaculia bacterium]